MNAQQPPEINSRRGVAMVISLIAIVIVGGLIAATFGPVLLEQRLAENAKRADAAFAAAEYGIGEVVGSWSTYDAYQLSVVGPPSAFPRPVSGTLSTGAGSYSGNIWRVGDAMFLLDLEGRDRSGQAQSKVGYFWRLTLIQMDIQSALTTQGSTNITGNAQITGTDVRPVGWSGCRPLANRSGHRLANPADVTTGGACSGASCISGTPPVQVDPTLDSNTFFLYGDLTWADLTSLATKRFAPGNYQIQPVASGTTCSTSLPTNWGDPLNQSSPCAQHFPIVYATGDLTLNGNVGQGILLVEGDLSLQGGYEHFGVVVVRGALKSAGTGGTINGAVMAGNVNGSQNQLTGNARINYSSCALMMAFRYGAPGSPLRSRGWINSIVN